MLAKWAKASNKVERWVMKPESGQQLNFILLQISQPYQTLMSWEWRKQSPRKSVFIYLFCSLTAQRKHGKQCMLMLTTGLLIEPFQKLETCYTIILCSKHLAAFHKKAWWCIQPPHFLANDTAESIRHIMVTQWISKKRTKTRLKCKVVVLVMRQTVFDLLDAVIIVVA